MMARKQVLANLVELKLTDFEDVDSLIKVKGDKLFIAIEQSLQGELNLWENASSRPK